MSQNSPQAVPAADIKLALSVACVALAVMLGLVAGLFFGGA